MQLLPKKFLLWKYLFKLQNFVNNVFGEEKLLVTGKWNCTI